MNTTEFQRLLAYHHAKQISHQHQPFQHGKRYVKGHAKAVGQVLKDSYIKPQVGIERIFKQFS